MIEIVLIFFVGWFIICQILTTLCFVAELVDIVILFVVWVSQGGTKKDQQGKNRVPTTLVQTGTILTVASSKYTSTGTFLLSDIFDDLFLLRMNPKSRGLSLNFILTSNKNVEI